MTEQQDDAKDRSPTEPPVQERGLWRALLLGGLLCVGLAIFVPWNDLVLKNTQLYNNYLPPLVTLLLVIVGVVVNPLLGRFRLSTRELTIIVVMLLALGGVVSSGLARYLPTTIAYSASVLESQASLRKLHEELSGSERHRLRQEVLIRLEHAAARRDTDGDGFLDVTEAGLGEGFARLDDDGDGRIAYEQWIAQRVQDPRLVPTWRWPVAHELYLGVPAYGPIRSGDPEYAYLVDRYLSGVRGTADGDRVVHRALVTWRDATGAVHGPMPALGGRVALEAFRRGEVFLDLDDPATGALLRGRTAGETHGGLTVLAVDEPTVPWLAWAQVFWRWLPLIVGAIVAMIAVAGIVRRQWIDHERLTYPIAQVTRALIDNPEPGRRWSAIFRGWPFWVGVLIACFALVWRGLHQYGYLPVDLRLEMLLDFPEQPFHGEFWAQAPAKWGLYRPTIYFNIVAITFFLATEISFSLWFWFVASNVVGLILIDQGINVTAKHVADLSVGAMIMLGLLILWIGRNYYGRLFLAAVRPSRDPVIRRHVPYVYGLLIGSGLMVAFFVLAGAWFWHAVLVVLLILGALLVLARIVAEAGLPFLQMPWAAFPNSIIFTLTGFTFPPSALLPLALVGTTLLADPRESLLPYAVNADYLADKEGLPQRRTSLLMIGVACSGAVLACGALIYWFSSADGAMTDGWPATLIKRDAFVAVASGTAREASADGSLFNAQARADTLMGYGVGAAAVGGIGAARLFFSWWPLHPIGLVVMACYPMWRVWFSVFLGWLLKWGVMRYGGTGVYQRMKPVAIGLIAGEAIVTLGFILVTIIAHLFFGEPMRPYRPLPG